MKWYRLYLCRQHVESFRTLSALSCSSTCLRHKQGVFFQGAQMPHHHHCPPRPPCVTLLMFAAHACKHLSCCVGCMWTCWVAVPVALARKGPQAEGRVNKPRLFKVYHNAGDCAVLVERSGVVEERAVYVELLCREPSWVQFCDTG